MNEYPPVETGRSLDRIGPSVRESTIGEVLVLGAAAGFGTLGIFGEMVVAIDLEPATLLPVRYVFATLVVTALALARGWGSPGPNWTAWQRSRPILSPRR